MASARDRADVALNIPTAGGAPPMLRILVLATFAMLVMVLVKDGRVLAQAGLLSSCESVATPAGKTGYWQACRAGRLDGHPDLSRQLCKTHTMAENVEYWRCATPLESGRI
jgi:hypothetical protein